ncbi:MULTISPECIES: hypothetical protein [unclassified Rhizobium]
MKTPKIPDIGILQDYIAAGLDLLEIADRCGAKPKTLRQILSKANLKVRSRTGRQPRHQQPQVTMNRLPVRLCANRTIFTRRVISSETGATQFIKIPLPRISLHVDQLREDRRC